MYNELGSDDNVIIPKIGASSHQQLAGFGYNHPGLEVGRFGHRKVKSALLQTESILSIDPPTIDLPPRSSG